MKKIKFIGIELDNDYFDIGAERMRNYWQALNIRL